jgi:hypothetical protein
MKYLKLLLLIVGIFLLSLHCCGCAPEKVDIDWTMYGMWIGEDGQVENTFEFHMVGKSAVYPDDPQSGRLELSIQWPEDFRFNTEQANEHTLGFTIEREDSYFLTGMLLSDDLHTSQIVPGSFALAPEKGYFLMYWEVPDGSYEIPGYLIASTDPNTSREEIEEFFAPTMTDERFQ